MTATRDVQLTLVTDQGDDILTVQGTVDGNDITATGWISAMTNYYPPDAYGDDGHLVDGAQPRPMTPAEQQAYWKTLLLDAAPAAVEQAAPVVLFQAPVDTEAPPP